MTDFDKRSDRTRSTSEKWNRQVLLKNFGRDDVLPFWIADMEFEAPLSVSENLVRRAKDGNFSYECQPDSLRQAISDWYSRRHGWSFDTGALCFTPGTMNTVSIVLNLYTSEGDGVIVQPPVYFEFQRVITDNNRRIVSNPLRRVDNRYEMDFDDLERKAAEPRTKMLILSNPHNPVGRVWEASELQRLSEICLNHNVLIIADEVHGDFVFSERTFTPIASISDDVAHSSFSCLSPSKTFNLPAITDSFVVISNDDHRADFECSLRRLSLNQINAFSVVATETAYRSGEQWLDQAIDYVQDNVRFLKTALTSRIPRVQLVQPEGTFLAWVDFRNLRMDVKQLETFLSQQARLALKPGHSFGQEGAGYARMSVACPKSMVEEGVARLEQAVNFIGS